MMTNQIKEALIKGLSHITFICKDLEKTAAMFKSIFSAEEIYSSDDKTFSISKEKFFQVANIWIAIMEGDPVEKTYNHIAFRVNEEALDDFEVKVRSFGLTVLPSRKREEGEGRSLYFYDYDNHLFELHTGDLNTRLEWYEPKKDQVDITTYDPNWPDQASLEIKKLRAELPQSKIIDIQHVGSTAIPGMAAKPIIDIQIAVHSLEEMKTIAISALQKLGYEYWYENPDPERMFFVKGMPPFGEKRTHHVHIVEPSSKHWTGKINFRDYLISHPEIAKEYQELKIKLAKQHTYDREKYTNAKTEFVNKILKLMQQK